MWRFTSPNDNFNMSRLVTKPTNWHVRPAKTQISLGIHPVWSESSLSPWRKLGSLATHWAHSEDSDQTGRTVTLLVLSWGGSYRYLLMHFFNFSFETTDHMITPTSSAATNEKRFYMIMSCLQQYKSQILTHLAYVANGKKSCSILQQFTGRKCVALFAVILWHHPSHLPCLLDVRRCNIVFACYKRKKYL